MFVPRNRLALTVFALAVAVTVDSLAQSQDDVPSHPAGIVEYTAEYEVRYRGRRVARAEFSVAAGEDDQYTFNSSTRARGIWRIASPRPAVELSRFRVQGDRIVPVRFEYQDGSRSGDDNYSLEFDTVAGEVRRLGARGTESIPFEEGLLDRGSLQVALMRDLADCRAPGPYRYVDEDGTRVYRYERLENREAETGVGVLESLRFSQQRDGSSRSTILWLAPALGYLPVRIEQIRDGEIETVFSLEDYSGLSGPAVECSGFR